MLQRFAESSYRRWYATTDVHETNELTISVGSILSYRFRGRTCFLGQRTKLPRKGSSNGTILGRFQRGVCAPAPLYLPATRTLCWCSSEMFTLDRPLTRELLRSTPTAWRPRYTEALFCASSLVGPGLVVGSVIGLAVPGKR